MNIWQSVEQIQFFCGQRDLIHIVHKNQTNYCLSMFKPFFQDLFHFPNLCIA